MLYAVAFDRSELCSVGPRESRVPRLLGLATVLYASNGYVGASRRFAWTHLRPMSPPRTAHLELTRGEQWTLHHALLDRIDRERTAADATGIDPPPLAVYTAFETLEAGDDVTRFSVVQLEASRDVVSSYCDRDDWEADWERLERLYWKLTRALEGDRVRSAPDFATADD